METRQRRSKWNDFDAFTRNRAERVCKRNVNLAWHTGCFFPKKTSSLVVADKNFQKVEVRFFAVFPCSRAHATLALVQAANCFTDTRKSVAACRKTHNCTGDSVDVMSCMLL